MIGEAKKTNTDFQKQLLEAFQLWNRNKTFVQWSLQSNFQVASGQLYSCILNLLSEVGEEQEVTNEEELFHQSATTLTSKIVFEVFFAQELRGEKREVVDRTMEAIHRIVFLSLKNSAWEKVPEVAQP